MSELTTYSKEATERGRVMVVGCGALGNEVVKGLVLSGVKDLMLVDFDEVEEGNLTRSVMYRKEDVGLRKVDAAEKWILGFRENVKVSTIYGDVAHDVGLGEFENVDVVVGCVDSRWARYCINRMCMRAGKPWVDGGIAGLTGTCRVFIPGKNCYACSLGEDELNDLRRRMPCSGVIRRSEAKGHAATTAVIASIIGAVQVQEVIKLLNGGQDSMCGKMFCYDGVSLKSSFIGFEAWDEDCPVHERWAPVKDFGVSVQLPVNQLMLRCPYGGGLELRDDCFVDYIVSKRDDKKTMVMLPGRKVAAFVEEDRELGGLPLSEYYQHEYRVIDKDFPYQEMTLGELGVVGNDVLRFNDFFVKVWK